MEKEQLKEFFAVTAGELYRVFYERSNAAIIWLAGKEEKKIIRNEESREKVYRAGTNQRIGISSGYLSIYNGPFSGGKIPRPENVYMTNFIWRSPSPIIGLFLDDKKALNYFTGRGSRKILLSETKKTIKAIGGDHPKFIFSIRDSIVPEIEKILQ